MTSNTFNIDRIAHLWNFYTPFIRRHWLIFGTTLLVAYALCLIGVTTTEANTDSSDFISLMSFSIGANIAELTYLCGPLMFAFCRTRRIETTMPISWTEQSAFLLAYTLVLYPLFLALVWYCSTGVCSLFTTSASVNTSMLSLLSLNSEFINLFDLMEQSKPLNICGLIMNMSCVAWAVTASRRNRLAWGIVAVFAGEFLNFVAGVSIGVLAFTNSQSFVNLANGITTDISGRELTLDIYHEFIQLLPQYYCVLICLSVLMLVLTVYKIRNRQN